MEDENNNIFSDSKNKSDIFKNFHVSQMKLIKDSHNNEKTLNLNNSIENKINIKKIENNLHEKDCKINEISNEKISYSRKSSNIKIFN